MGAERITAAFRRARAARRTALVAYVTAGYPSLLATEFIVRELAARGVDLIELGIPFSDPLADGPTIQAASAEALANGATVRGILQMVRRVRGKTTVPLVAMSYVNPLARYGMAAFCRDAVAAGFDGLVVPDLPPEEAGELICAARPVRLATIFLAAPTSPIARLRRIAAASRGFIYYVSLTGVTGARRALPPEVLAQVRWLKRLTRLPVAVGFGVSKPEQVRWLGGVADGVVVGSAIVQAITRHRLARGPYRRSVQRRVRHRDLARRVGSFVQPLLEAARR